MSEDLTDSFVADLLKKEAADRSLRYSAMGLQAFTPARRANGAPKPNTRFLQNLMKETDQHNTTLLAKEAEEARLRLRRLQRKQDNLSRGDRDDGNHDDKRQKRRRDDGESHNGTRRRSIERYNTRRDELKDGNGNGHKRRSGEGRRTTDDRTHQTRDRSRDHKRRKRHDSHSSTSRSRSRSRSPRRRKDDTKRESRSYRHKDRNRSISKSRSPNGRDTRRTKRKRDRSQSPAQRLQSPHQKSKHHREHSKNTRNQATKQTRSRSRSRSQSIPSESSDEIGPYLPKSLQQTYTSTKPIQVRGRGAINGESAMSARFDSSYDPTVDVQPENPEDADDWDMALEAMRDRAKWRQQGAERLRSAGFDEGFIDAWETNKTEDASRIKWKKEKEGREWDRGKVVDDDGDVKVKADWARLLD